MLTVNNINADCIGSQLLSRGIWSSNIRSWRHATYRSARDHGAGVARAPSGSRNIGRSFLGLAGREVLVGPDDHRVCTAGRRDPKGVMSFLTRSAPNAVVRPRQGPSDWPRPRLQATGRCYRRMHGNRRFQRSPERSLVSRRDARAGCDGNASVRDAGGSATTDAVSPATGGMMASGSIGRCMRDGSSAVSARSALARGCLTRGSVGSAASTGGSDSPGSAHMGTRLGRTRRAGASGCGRGDDGSGIG